MNRNEASKLVTVAVAACAQGARLTYEQVESTIDAWLLLLGDLTFEHASCALATVLQTSPYLPAVADIRRAAVELVHGPRRPGAEAWGDVKRAMGSHGAYRTPGVDFRFDDPIVAQLVSTAFGWRELCASENAVADRARFIEAYDKLAGQARIEAQAPALGEASQRARSRLPGSGPRKLIDIIHAAGDEGRMPWDPDEDP